MDLISKKELLQITGISYGQLYRWKREKLIPEEWFIKQSSFTGQETFLPRELILPRIEAILGNKDKYSLTELSRMLSPDTAPALIDGKALMQNLDMETVPKWASDPTRPIMRIGDFVWRDPLYMDVFKKLAR